jgi:hypothetical protein
LASSSLLALLLLSQESFHKILTFLFEIARRGRTFEQIADRFFRFFLHLLLDLSRQVLALNPYDGACTVLVISKRIFSRPPEITSLAGC